MAKAIYVQVEGGKLDGQPFKRLFKQGCDICHAQDLDEFVDGAVAPAGGAWANMCLSCHKKHGIGLGIGVGQRYKLQREKA